jgi:ABC-type bacteriocin/lantibiotic exporter with double-glycine peptidase domain
VIVKGIQSEVTVNICGKIGAGKSTLATVPVVVRAVNPSRA